MGFPIVVLTDQRMIAHFPQRHELTSFWHGALVGFTPSMAQGSLELVYSDCPAVPTARTKGAGDVGGLRLMHLPDILRSGCAMRNFFSDLPVRLLPFAAAICRSFHA